MVLQWGGGGREEAHFNGLPSQQVEEFIYLGPVVQSIGKIDMDATHRIKAG